MSESTRLCEAFHQHTERLKRAHDAIAADLSGQWSVFAGH